MWVTGDLGKTLRLWWRFYCLRQYIARPTTETTRSAGRSGLAEDGMAASMTMCFFGVAGQFHLAAAAQNLKRVLSFPMHREPSRSLWGTLAVLSLPRMPPGYDTPGRIAVEDNILTRYLTDT